MSTLRLETVLIGDIVDGVGLTIISNKGEATLDGDGFIFSSDIFQFTFFLMLGTITGLGTKIVLKSIRYTQESFMAFLELTRNCNLQRWLQKCNEGLEHHRWEQPKPERRGQRKQSGISFWIVFFLVDARLTLRFAKFEWCYSRVSIDNL